MKKIVLILLFSSIFPLILWPRLRAQAPPSEVAKGILSIIKPKQGVASAIVFHIPGFGFNTSEITDLHDEIIELQNSKPEFEHLAHIILNPLYGCTYHFFTDAKENGDPEGLFITRTIPFVRNALGASEKVPLFLTGHSSGGWSALHLYLNHISLFKGVWSVAPDPLDFSQFFKANLYRDQNLYISPDGIPHLAATDSKMTLKEYVQSVEESNAECESDLFAYERAYGSPLFDRQTGQIIKAAFPIWSKFDLRKRLIKLNSSAIHIRIIVGDKDQYWLNESATTFCEELEKKSTLGPCTTVLGRGHRDVGFPSPQFPDGLLKGILGEMSELSR